MKKPFQVTGERILSAYDLNDLLQNRSYIKFYAARAGTSGDVLISEAVVSSSPATQDYLTYELNFDATIQTPVIIQGDCYIKMAYCMTIGGTPYRTLTPTVRLLKVVGAAETELCSVTFPVTGAVAGVVTDTMMKATLARTSLAIGNKLRMEIVATISVTTGSSETILFHSPDGRTATITEGVRPTSPQNSILYALIPFVPNL